MFWLDSLKKKSMKFFFHFHKSVRITRRPKFCFCFTAFDGSFIQIIPEFFGIRKKSFIFCYQKLFIGMNERKFILVKIHSNLLYVNSLPMSKKKWNKIKTWYIFVVVVVVIDVVHIYQNLIILYSLCKILSQWFYSSVSNP